MFNAFVRLVIFCSTLFVAWLATGRLLAATHPADLAWLGYAQAVGVELTLAYCIWLIARTSEKGIIAVMILFFGLFSVAAQVLHAHFFGAKLPDEENLPATLVIAWRYVLPAVPTIAGVSVGLLELAENRRDRPNLLDWVSEKVRRAPIGKSNGTSPVKQKKVKREEAPLARSNGKRPA